MSIIDDCTEALLAWLIKHPDDYPLSMTSAEQVLEGHNDNIHLFAVHANDRTFRSICNKANRKYENLNQTEHTGYTLKGKEY